MPDKKSVRPPEPKPLDVEISATLRRRRAASWRLPAFDEHGHRDDLDRLADEIRNLRPDQPFGLSEAVRRRHGNDLVMRWHWTVAEVEQVLGVRPKVAA